MTLRFKTARLRVKESASADMVLSSTGGRTLHRQSISAAAIKQWTKLRHWIMDIST